MAFPDYILLRTDDDAATVNGLITAAGSAVTRLTTQNTAIDDIEESFDWRGSQAGIVVAINKLTLNSSLMPDGALNGLLSSVFGAKMLGYDTDVARYALSVGLPSMNTLRKYLVYLNYGDGVVSDAAWQYLVAPTFRRIYEICLGALGAKLVFAPALNDLGHKDAGGSFVAGADVVGGGYVLNGVKTEYDFVDGKINSSLYAGAAVLNLTSANITGSGTVTVVGDGYSADGTVFTDHAGTLAVSGNTTAAVTPAVPGDIFYKCSEINIPGTISVGTLTAKCAVPAGRTNPPV